MHIQHSRLQPELGSLRNSATANLKWWMGAGPSADDPRTKFGVNGNKPSSSSAPIEAASFVQKGSVAAQPANRRNGGCVSDPRRTVGRPQMLSANYRGDWSADFFADRSSSQPRLANGVKRRALSVVKVGDGRSGGSMSGKSQEVVLQIQILTGERNKRIILVSRVFAAYSQRTRNLETESGW
ncbi:hypothetical protein B0H16DRAFT_1452655 [Mycena metata]|uniref:Uncharacterized protein n=1 Tax=Mycena metata TaxID=1033252 RepID=A0AAD7JPX1_9AGAR|nr:hypothetical protein B0H16DRAFT_1452655 [Mycena metata]